MKKMTMALVATLLMFNGCSSKEEEKKVHTVEYYKKHVDERMDILTQFGAGRCAGEDKQNCINARKAEKEIYMEKFDNN